MYPPFPASCKWSSDRTSRFRKPPYDPGRSDLPSPVLTLALPLTAFPRQRKLKCWFIYTPHCIGLQVRLDLSPGYGSTVMSGSVSGLHLFQTRQAPRAPLHGARCYLARQGVSHPGQQALPRLHRSYGLMRQSYALLVPRCYPYTLGLRRLLPAPAGRRTFPTLSLRIFPNVPGPIPRRPPRCFTRFFPQGFGLP